MRAASPLARSGLQDRLDLAHLGVGIADRRALRRGHRDEEHAAILGRHQLLRQAR